MKKIFSFLTMLLLTCSMAWAANITLFSYTLSSSTVFDTETDDAWNDNSATGTPGGTCSLYYKSGKTSISSGNNPYYQIGGNVGAIKLTLSGENTFQTGDIVSVKYVSASSSDTRSYSVRTAYANAPTYENEILSAGTDGTIATQSVTLDANFNNLNSIFIQRYNSQTIRIYSVTVTRSDGEPEPTFTITYANATGATGVVPAAKENITSGTEITLPKNFSMYKDGYTMTGWTDGENNFAPGAKYEVTENKTLTAVYTANTVTLADHADAVTIKWEFSQSVGVPALHFEGNSGFVVAQATVNGSKLDVKLPIDATSGKFANSANTWTQVNPGAIFTIPSENGAVITYKQYDNGDVTTPVINVSSTDATYALTAAGTSGNLYYEYIQIVLPESPSIKLIDGGVMNTTDFRGTFSLKDENYTVSGVDYTKCVSLGNTNSTMIGLYDPSKFVAYDSNTDVTDITIVVWNKNTSDKNLVLLVVPEGAEVASCIPETIAVAKSSGLVKYIHMTGRSTLYCSVNSTDIRFCQIKVFESGNPLPAAGEVGYSVNHNLGRLAATSGSAAYLDGIEYVVSSNAKVLNTTETKIKTLGTHYIKFTTTSNVRLKVTTSNTAHYYVATAKNGTTNEVTPTANEASSIDLTAGTWYINPVNGDVKITKIEFVELSSISITPANEKSTYVTKFALDFSDVAGLKAYVATAAADGVVTLSEVGTVPAATPLVLIGTADTEYTVPVVASASALGANMLVAGDGTTEFDGSTYDYILFSDGLFYQIGEGTVAKDKAYLHCTSNPNPSLAPTLRIAFEENNATDIQNIEGSEKAVKFFQNGNLYILRDGVVYDVTGAKVR